MRLMIPSAALATSISLALSLAGGAPAIGQAGSTSAESGPAGDWLRWHGNREQFQARFPGVDSGIDYGSFQWLPAAVVDGHPPDPATTGTFELDLGGLRFDPLAAPPTPSAPANEGWQASEGADWRLLQFNGPIKGEWLDALRAAGIEPVQYIHPFAYVVWAEARAMTRASLPDSVRWFGEHPPGFRVAPMFRSSNRAVVGMQAMIRRGHPEILDALREAGAEVVSSTRTDRHFDGVLLRAPASSTLALAAIPGVYTVQPVATDGGTRSEMSVQINAGNVDEDGVVFPGYLDYLAGIGLDGGGVIMACVDDGIQVNHPDLAGRMLTCTGPSCGSGNQTSGHGTHVAGIMAGDAASGTTNTGGFLRGQGMAPAANLVEQRSSPRPGVDGMLNLMRDSVRNDASISNNSWGPAGSPRGYDLDTRYTDIGVRDADIDAEGDQPLTYVLAIMNGGGGTSSQGSPDEAKNLFTIGSTWAQVNANTQDMRNDHISSNSAHGPALDGRFIPHMLAASRFTDSPIGSNSYAMQGGTSQAAPHVAGATALFTQYYRERFGTEPSPALIKAAFIARARDLVGNNDANNNPIGARPDSKQGWGRMQLSATVAPELPVIYVDQSHVFTETGQTWQAQYSAADPEQPMQLMLVWTDAPGHGTGGSTPAWNNDLDLRVGIGEDTFLGNVFTDGWSVTGGSADERNNTEGVFLQPEQHGGAISVEVLAANINSNALPNAGDDNAQDFALVCYNCVEAAGGTHSDLALTMTDVPDPVTAGETLTYVFGVVNFGPDDADHVQIGLTLPDAASYTLNRSLGDGPAWQCLDDDLQLVCTLPDALAAASQAPMLEVDVRIAVNTPPGIVQADASVGSDSADPRPENDQAQESTQVLRAPERLFDDGFECHPETIDCGGP